ncbi:uncharacterized protein BJX67DRAFT_383308 [Aspergillus lucknowensis]|uniref:Uncharacterized protein n=1 Tax=Aspergillus lucknowensis TaxID=176173 RepID=A0ABR4LK28_9EURO
MSPHHVVQNPLAPSIHLYFPPDGARLPTGRGAEHNDAPSNGPPGENVRIIRQPGTSSHGRARSCGLMIKDRIIRTRLYELILSTILLLIDLAVYLVFVVVGAIGGRWTFIVLIFVLLLLGVLWCYSLIRR